MGSALYGIGAFLACFAVNIPIYWQYLEGFEPRCSISILREFQNHPTADPYLRISFVYAFASEPRLLAAHACVPFFFGAAAALATLRVARALGARLDLALGAPFGFWFAFVASFGSPGKTEYSSDHLIT